MLHNRVAPFMGGCFVSGILALNHTAETERVNAELRREIRRIRKIDSFSVDDIGKVRDNDTEMRQIEVLESELEPFSK